MNRVDLYFEGTPPALDESFKPSFVEIGPLV